jgi:hypothetical protein
MGYKVKLNAVFMSAVFLCNGCSFDNEQDLFGRIQCAPFEGVVSYSGFIEPLIKKNCVTCHNGIVKNGNVNLENYEALIPHIENGKFIGTIRHDPGFEAMPQGGTKISRCDIEKIESWISNNYPDN